MLSLKEFLLKSWKLHHTHFEPEELPEAARRILSFWPLNSDQLKRSEISFISRVDILPRPASCWSRIQSMNFVRSDRLQTAFKRRLRRIDASNSSSTGVSAPSVGYASGLASLPAGHSSRAWPLQDRTGLKQLLSVTYDGERLRNRRRREFPRRALEIPVGLLTCLLCHWRPPTHATREQAQGWLERRRTSSARESVTWAEQSLVPWRGAPRAMCSANRTLLRF